ncbi:hypothetical protein [Mesorhizobium sp.]|uniref:hypothetical protein n=1 Tax=Mesorhizobium sp. TaxID=1871066 RepID=UPI0025E7AC88|nr:hypothetical protein [Mesorhizobium sp.]
MLRAAGHSFLLLEAMDRTGGRAWIRDRQFGVPLLAAPGCMRPTAIPWRRGALGRKTWPDTLIAKL